MSIGHCLYSETLPNFLSSLPNPSDNLEKSMYQIWQIQVTTFFYKSKLQLSEIQGGITCGAIDEPRKSSKAIVKRVIINFCNNNVVIARFRDKNVYR